MSSEIAKIAADTMQKAGLHQVEIKDQMYTIELLPATTALAVATDLFKVAAPAFAAFFEGTERKDIVMPEEDNTYTQVAILLVNHMDKVSVLELVNIITSKVYKNSVPIDVDEEFKGNLGGLMILLEFILKENTGPLLKDWFEAKGLIAPFRSNQEQEKEETSEQ